MDYLKTGIEILNKIESNGYSAYIVGGAVRDYILGNTIHDIDIATNIPLDKLESLYDVQRNGQKYASVTVCYKGYSFELTHYRKDIEYKDYRHPKVILVEQFEEDILRRDFTMNALAMDKNYGILDLVNGKQDIEQGIIRCIGIPRKRFEEDALRILRALYFSAKLNFTIEEETLLAMKECSILLTKLSNDKIYQHFMKIVYAPYERGKEYIKNYHLFSDIVEYERWIDIADSSISLDDLEVYYYLTYGSYPPMLHHKNKKRCEIAKQAIESKFSVVFIFWHQKEIQEFFYVFSKMGYDIIDIKNRIKNLKIKNTKDLAMSEKDIAVLFERKKKSIAIQEVIKAILENRIDNTRHSIELFLQGLDVIEC